MIEMYTQTVHILCYSNQGNKIVAISVLLQLLTTSYKNFLLYYTLV